MGLKMLKRELKSARSLVEVVEVELDGEKRTNPGKSAHS